MPGPANNKGRKKRQAKKNKTKGGAKNDLEQKLAEIRGEVAPSRPNTAAARVKTPLISRPPTVAAPIVEESRGRSRSRVLPHEEDVIPEEAVQPEVDSERYFLYNGEYYERIPPEEMALYNGMEAEVVRYEDDYAVEEHEEGHHYEGPEEPYIYDPGNGPRVRDFTAFIQSPFAVMATVDFVLVGEPKDSVTEDVDWTDEELISLLARVVPDELALVLWYNRTRSTHRICPTCQRVYHVGEALRPHLPGVDTEEGSGTSSEDEIKRHAARTAEQWLSGICSIPCFALSTYTLGLAAVLAYGLMWSQLDEGTKLALQPDENEERIDDQGLSAYVALSRCTGREMLMVLTREEG